MANERHPLDRLAGKAASCREHITASNLQAEKEGEPPAAESEALSAVKALPRTSQLPKAGQDFAVLEDPRMSESSSAIGLMSQLLNLVSLTRQLAANTRR